MTWGRFDPPMLRSASTRRRSDERRTTARPVACPFARHCLATHSHGATCRSRQKSPRLDHSALPSRTQPERSRPRARQAIVASCKRGCKQTKCWPPMAALPASAATAGIERRTERSRHGPRSGPDFAREWRRRESNPRPSSYRLNLYKLRLPLGFARRPVGSRPTFGLAILWCRASGDWLSLGAEPVF